MTESTVTLTATRASPAIPLETFDDWIAGFDRRMIAMDARWLVLGETDPFADPMSDYAARSILRTPAIVWG